jgi:hypothetical protein
MEDTVGAVVSPVVTTRVAECGVGPDPWQPAPVLAPLTVIVDDPVGVAAAVLIVRLVVCGEPPEPVVTSGFVANVAVAPVGSPEAAKVTLH